LAHFECRPVNRSIRLRDGSTSIAMVMPSNRRQTSALLAGQQKAARALHRAAPETTADCAVPPLFH
jgi:hypothetical protein